MLVLPGLELYPSLATSFCQPGDGTVPCTSDARPAHLGWGIALVRLHSEGVRGGCTVSLVQFAMAVNTCKNLSLDGLVVIGGDDSNTNACLLAEHFR